MVKIDFKVLLFIVQFVVIVVVSLLISLHFHDKRVTEGCIEEANSIKECFKCQGKGIYSEKGIMDACKEEFALRRSKLKEKIVGFELRRIPLLYRLSL